MQTSRYSSAWILALAVMLVSPLIASAACDQAEQDRGLKLVFEAADHLCGSISAESSVRTSEIGGKLEAEVPKLVADFVSVGGEIEAKAKDTSTKGVLQKDLAQAMKNSADCKLRVLESLRVTMIPPCQTTTASGEKPVPAIDLDAILRNTDWNAATGENAKRKAWDEIPWTFHPNQTVNAADRWVGSWKRLTDDTIRVHLVAGTAQDEFDVRFETPTSFVAYKPDDPEYRRGERR